MAERKEAGMSDEGLFVVPYDPDDETFETVDWKANPYEVLERVNALLRPHHLVVMLADSGSDEYPFKIVQRPGSGGQPDGGGNPDVVGQPALVWNAKTKGWHVLGEDGTRFELVAAHA